MKSGDAHVVAGWRNKVSAALSHFTPDSVPAEHIERWPSRDRRTLIRA